MPLTLQNSDNPYVVSQEVLGFKTHLQTNPIQPTKKQISVHAQTEAVKPCMKTIGENPEWWATDGRAKNGHANKLIIRFFHNLTIKVSDHCKFLVHSYNDTFYNFAKTEFDKLTSDTTFTERRETWLSRKSNSANIKFGQKVITYYRSGREIAHHFLRVFRHSEFLETIVLQYYSFRDKNNESLLRTLLQRFLTKELEIFDKYQRLACEKNVLTMTLTNLKILDALHNTLLKMKDKVVLLYWCSEWKDEFLFFFYKHGPCAHLLHPQQKSNSLAYTTPTLKLKNVKCHIFDIFNRNTCNQLAQISLNDWVLLIQSSYDGTLDKCLQYAETGQNVDLKTLYKDKKLYKAIYIKKQNFYSQTKFKDITYKWHLLERSLHHARAKKFDSVSLSETGACFTMQAFDKNYFTIITKNTEDYEMSDREFSDDGQDEDDQDDDGSQGSDESNLGSTPPASEDTEDYADGSHYESNPHSERSVDWDDDNHEEEDEEYLEGLENNWGP